MRTNAVLSHLAGDHARYSDEVGVRVRDWDLEVLVPGLGQPLGVA